MPTGSPEKRSRLIIGLGNPGPRYRYTRHNIGFLLIEKFLLPAFNVALTESVSGAHAGKITWRGFEVHFLLPQKFMNLSGEVVRRYSKKHELGAEEILVIHDDLDIPLGALRFRESGSSGGHRGVESLLAELETNTFDRLRVGIGRPPKGADAAAYVLENFTREEEELLPLVLGQAAQIVLAWVDGGPKKAKDILSAYSGLIKGNE